MVFLATKQSVVCLIMF